jgi:hypothetical protein
VQEQARGVRAGDVEFHGVAYAIRREGVVVCLLRRLGLGVRQLGCVNA